MNITSATENANVSHGAVLRPAVPGSQAAMGPAVPEDGASQSLSAGDPGDGAVFRPAVPASQTVMHPVVSEASAPDAVRVPLVPAPGSSARVINLSAGNTEDQRERVSQRKS